MMTPCSRHIGRLEVRSFVLQKYLSGHVFKVEAGTVNGALVVGRADEDGMHAFSWRHMQEAPERGIAA